MTKLQELFVNPTFRYWFIVFPVAWVVLALLFRGLNWWPNKTRRGSYGADVMAYQIIAGYGLVYLSVVGVIAWLKLNPEWDLAPLEADHYLGKSPFVDEHLMIPMFGYQFWNTIASLGLAQFREGPMIGHHLVTCLLAYFCVGTCLHYYACFFFGFAELTNLPLHIVDTFKQFPEYRKDYGFIDEACKAVFAIGFFILRIVYWSVVVYDMVSILIPRLIAGNVHSFPVVSFFVGSAVFLTGLQYFWGYKIFHIVMGSSTGKEQKHSKKK